MCGSCQSDHSVLSPLFIFLFVFFFFLLSIYSNVYSLWKHICAYTLYPVFSLHKPRGSFVYSTGNKMKKRKKIKKFVITKATLRRWYRHISMAIYVLYSIILEVNWRNERALKWGRKTKPRKNKKKKKPMSFSPYKYVLWLYMHIISILIVNIQTWALSLFLFCHPQYA